MRSHRNTIFTRTLTNANISNRSLASNFTTQLETWKRKKKSSVKYHQQEHLQRTKIRSMVHKTMVQIQHTAQSSISLVKLTPKFIIWFDFFLQIQIQSVLYTRHSPIQAAFLWKRGLWKFCIRTLISDNIQKIQALYYSNLITDRQQSLLINQTYVSGLKQYLIMAPDFSRCIIWNFLTWDT